MTVLSLILVPDNAAQKIHAGVLAKVILMGIASIFTG